MHLLIRRPVILGLISGFLLDLPFPIAGPLPPWRAAFAWIALVPLLYGLLAECSVKAPRYLRRSALAGYACGVLWYVLNCYWIYDTMLIYGNVPAPGAVGILLLYSMVLGLYFALFGLLIALCRKAFRSNMIPLLLAPFFWVAIELAASRITSVPWDQLGYSQVDNFLLTRLAPLTGVYGISFVLIAVNALLAAVLLARSIHMRLRIGVGAVLMIVLLQSGCFFHPKSEKTSDYAVLLQPNLDVGVNNIWVGQEWDENASHVLEMSQQYCTPAIAGMPTPNARILVPQCPQNPPAPGLIAWPEAPSALISDDPRTIALLHTIATTTHAPVIAGMIGRDETGTFNSAVFTESDGNIIGRYDKIHLVPFGEFVPYRNVFFFAKHLTQQVGDFNRGKSHSVFLMNGHHFGAFICYESIFADEVRQFAVNGAQVFVNISDDGWYGDTSAPWQHLNMARMRAIENHRWVLRDTNNGVTTSIDPQGRVTFSAPRHVTTSLAVGYGYEDGLTFYSRHGDVFAILCGIISIVAVALALRFRLNLKIKVRSH
ncbi:MAG TPA: apolipoprotein N-acyltransferase [Pseudacidobacterium sp.]|jgi:apolipoprotein N-acyltransferase|nr:apolipoprotein N-acyltransferase [Pseudacidobacterium sp.]